MSLKCKRTVGTFDRMIVDGVFPEDLASLAAKQGYLDVVADVDDLGGYTEIINGQVTAIGGVRLYPDGRLWLGLIGSCKPIYHRWALRFLRALKEQGVKEVWSYPDRTISGSEKWLRRLGFTYMSNEEWRLCLKSH